MGICKSPCRAIKNGDAMKRQSAAEHFFHPSYLPHVGGALAGLRIIFAWTMTHGLLAVHEAMPDSLERIRAQAVPFIEAFATAWAFSWWHGVLIVAGCLFALGTFTRGAAGALSLFFIGALCIDYAKVNEIMGAWWGVAGVLLCIGLISRWGHVFGGDDLLERVHIKKSKSFRLRS